MGSVREHVWDPVWPARCVLLAECTVQVTHGGTCARVENPSEREVCFFYARVTSWLPARVVRDPAGGSNPCRMVPSMWDEVRVQLHDVTGKVQQVRLCLPCKDARGASAALEMRILNLTSNQFGTKKSKPRFRVNMISLGRGEKSPVLSTGYYL